MFEIAAERGTMQRRCSGDSNYWNAPVSPANRLGAISVEGFYGD